jgi:Gas vesicle synthesis protein GvpL/GvpF
VSRVLVYCGFLQTSDISTPPCGVNQAPVNALASDRLCLLWSEIEWPFEQARLQRNVLEFHEVVHHVFGQTAVVPFRLLSIFDDANALHCFVEENRATFIADLERLQDFVQMESVIYVINERPPADADSARAYLEQKAAGQRLAQQHAAAVKNALQDVSEDLHVRQVKNGSRIFALVHRRDEERFRKTVESVAVPGPVSRRISGPWPAAEFLSATVKAPGVAGRP